MSSTLESPPRSGPQLLDFQRFALATLVIYSHSFALLSGSDHSDPLFQWSRGQVSWGGLAVDAFFILSGYLVTQSWLNSSSLRSFMRKRVLRIYPAFAVAVAFAVLAIAPVSGDVAPRIDGLKWLLGTLNLHGYSPEGAFAQNPVVNELNGSLWSISYEFFCYIGVAALGLSTLLKRRGLMLGLLLVTIAVSIVFLVYGLNPGGSFLGVLFGHPPFWARLLPYYLVGTVFFLFRERIPLHWPLALVSIALLVAGVVIATIGVALLFPIALAYLLLFMAHLRVPVLRSWARYGDFSYGLYLYAFPIQQLLVRNFRELSPLALFALSTPLTLVMAFASWHLVEKPFVKVKTARAKPEERAKQALAPN